MKINTVAVNVPRVVFQEDNIPGNLEESSVRNGIFGRIFEGLVEAIFRVIL